MGFDWTKWATDEKLEDYVDEPISVWIKNFSKKFDIKIDIQVFKKEG